MTIKKFFEKGTKVSNLLDPTERRYVCCKVDGHLQDLNYVLPRDMECEITFLDLSNVDAVRIYEASLRMIVGMAVKRIDPKLDVRFFYNISRSVFCRVEGRRNFRITQRFVDLVEKKVKEIVAEDLPIVKLRMTKAEALELYRKDGLHDKIDVLRYRPESFAHVYEIKDGDYAYHDYLYVPLVPSTGYLSSFAFRLYEPGFLIQFPRAECQGTIPPFGDELKFATTLAGASRWAENNQLDTVSRINRFLKKNGEMAFINLCESKINNTLADLGRSILNHEDPIRLICIAGPSSSGKTSFANRLTFELMSLGLRPIRISIDDFYIPKGQLPKGADLESIDALDLPFFYKTIDAILQGEKVTLPSYSFKDGIRKKGREIVLDQKEPIIIEGIHALNRKMTENIPEHRKYKIYIAPQPQVNIDSHSPLSMTDLRLIRRISRDARTRGSDAKETISMWPGVRNGEFKYIYPTQENADFVFDSFMPYETCAMRNIALPLLDKIKPEEKEYTTAQRLKGILKYFLPMALEDVPCNSILREFIGGSSFKDAR